MGGGVIGVVVEQVVPGKAEAVYRAARDFVGIGQLMPNVVALTVLEGGGDSQVSEWEVAYTGQIVRWRQRDEFDDEHLVIRSRLAGNSFWKEYALECTFVPEAGTTRVRLHIRLQPFGFAQMLEPVARVLIRHNFETLLARLGERVGVPGSACSRGGRPRRE